MIKFNIISNRTSQHHVHPNENGMASLWCYYSIYDIKSNHEKIAEKYKLRDICKINDSFFIHVKVMKTKETLNKCHRLQKTKTTWPLNVMLRSWVRP